jgi:hypothetical protein
MVSTNRDISCVGLKWLVFFLLVGTISALFTFSVINSIYGPSQTEQHK